MTRHEDNRGKGLIMLTGLRLASAERQRTYAYTRMIRLDIGTRHNIQRLTLYMLSAPLRELIGER